MKKSIAHSVFYTLCTINIAQIVNYIRLVLKLVCTLRTYKKCDPVVGFSKYEFNKKLLVGVTFFRVTTSVT